MPHESDALVPLSDVTGPDLGPVYPIAPDYQAIEDAETAATTERRGEHLGSERGRAIPAEVADKFIENHPARSALAVNLVHERRENAAKKRGPSQAIINYGKNTLPFYYQPFEASNLPDEASKATSRNGMALIKAVQNGEVVLPPLEDPDYPDRGSKPATAK